MRKNKTKLLPLLLLSIAFALWGVSGTFIKISVDALPVSFFLLIRFGAAGLILLPFALRKYKKTSARNWARIVISSVIGLSGFMLIFGYGLQRTTAIEAAFIFLLSPIIMFVLSIEMLKEKFNSKILSGLLVALTGAALVISAPLFTGETVEVSGSFTGNIIVALSVFVSVLGTILIKPALNKVPLLQITTTRFLVAALSLVPVVAISNISLSEIEWSSQLITAVGFNILFGCVVAYSLYHWALERLSGEQSSVVHYLDPLAGVLSAIFILGDVLSPVIILGGGLTIFGVYLSEAKPKLKHHHFHAHK